MSGAWVESEPTVTVTADPFELDVVRGTPQEVIARFAQRSKADWDGEREERERADAARERRENEIGMRQLRGDPMPTSQDVFRRALVMADIADRVEDAAAQRERAERATFLAGELAAQAAAERDAELEKQSSRSTRALTRANEAIGRLRRSRETAEDYAANYTRGAVYFHQLCAGRRVWRSGGADGLARGGHTVGETVAFAEWTGDFEDWQAARRRQPGFVVTVPGKWWRGWRWLPGR